MNSVSDDSMLCLNEIPWLLNLAPVELQHTCYNFFYIKKLSGCQKQFISQTYWETAIYQAQNQKGLDLVIFMRIGQN